ncbi:MAG: mechanosensitive ion channel domain-containing protein [Bacteroidota bacterium]
MDNEFNLLDFFQNNKELILETGKSFLIALATLVIGFWLAGKIGNIVFNAANRSTKDPTVSRFLKSLANVAVKILVLLSAAGMVGFDTTSFFAVVGAAGLAVGLALQGSLSNFAGGVLILIFKPIRVGELIEAQGYIGHVKEIQIFVTTLITPENQLVVIPNGPLSNGIIKNLSREGQLRVDLAIGIAYGASIDTARKVIMEVMENDAKVMKNPAPSVNVLSLDDSAVTLAVRPYATPDDYWDVYFGITEKVKKALDANDIEIPFPQRVVHMQQD